MNKTSIAATNTWYQQPLGTALLKAELSGLTSVLPQIFGYYIVQIGGPNYSELLAASPIHNHILVNQEPASSDVYQIKCQLEELPFLPESIDVVVLFHLLEFSPQPMTILQEIYTALIPNGYVIIFGFNPYSLWSLTSNKDAPWSGSWLSPKHIRQYLAKIGFTIGDYKTFYFRPPSNNTEKFLALEGLGQIFWPYNGASYMFVAQKTISGLTPIKPLASLQKHANSSKALPKPTARQSCNSDR